MKLNGCRFWDGPIVFQRLARFTTSKPPTSVLWYDTFDIPTFWRGVTRALRNCESHNLTSAFLTRGTRVLRGIENQITQHRLYLQCSFIMQHLAFFLAWARAQMCHGSHPQESGRIPAMRVFLGKRLGVREGSAASQINVQSLVNARGILPEKHEEVNPRNPEREGIPPIHLPSKKIGNPRTVGRVTYKFIMALNPKRILLEKTQGIWGGQRDAHFLWKAQGIGSRLVA